MFCVLATAAAVAVEDVVDDMESDGDVVLLVLLVEDVSEGEIMATPVDDVVAAVLLLLLLLATAASTPLVLLLLLPMNCNKSSCEQHAEDVDDV